MRVLGWKSTALPRRWLHLYSPVLRDRVATTGAPSLAQQHHCTEDEKKSPPEQALRRWRSGAAKPAPRQTFADVRLKRVEEVAVGNMAGGRCLEIQVLHFEAKQLLQRELAQVQVRRAHVALEATLEFEGTTEQPLQEGRLNHFQCTVRPLGQLENLQLGLLDDELLVQPAETGAKHAKLCELREGPPFRLALCRPQRCNPCRRQRRGRRG